MQQDASSGFSNKKRVSTSKKPLCIDKLTKSTKRTTGLGGFLMQQLNSENDIEFCVLNERKGHLCRLATLPMEMPQAQMPEDHCLGLAAFRCGLDMVSGCLCVWSRAFAVCSILSQHTSMHERFSVCLHRI